MLKTFTEIKNTAKYGDYQRVAYICDCSVVTVRKVVDKERKDNFKIQYAFSKLFLERELLRRDVQQISIVRN